MLNWRNTLSDVEDAGEFAKNQMLSAANSAAKSAKGVSSQIESWATDGYEAIRDAAKRGDAAFWGAISVGMGALMGGLYALWRSSGRKPGRGRRRSARSMAVSSGMGRKMRSTGTGTRKPSRKATRSRRKKSA
jgi:hypothetical protein